VKTLEEIKGTVTTAISYAKTIDPKAKEQIRRMCSYELTEGSRVRIMPDVHAGKGCTIGTTMTILDKAVPNIVGVDIGCGMYTVDLGKQPIDFARLDEAAHEVPSGMHVWPEKQAAFDLKQLYCYEKLKKISWIECSIGTLGGGNHFIEIDETRSGQHYLIIHTGSRNLGKQVAEIYQRLAIELNAHGEPLEERMTHVIEAYKAAGRQKEIQQAIAALKHEQREKVVPDDLCYVSGKYLNQYLHDVALCQQFARLNREQIAGKLLELAGLTAGEAFHTIHNYIDVDEMILRKGAIAAHKGEKVLIPINMRDGSILAVGKGNPEWNYSAPHGAGRIMSRTQAIKELSLQEYQKEMAGIYTTSVNKGTLDEAPMAYKSLHDILDVIGDTVEVVEVMKPVYNFKAAEEKRF
jgi:tRNA-splicing ligase RtcB